MTIAFVAWMLGASLLTGAAETIEVPVEGWRYLEASGVPRSWPPTPDLLEYLKKDPPVAPANASFNYIAQATFDVPSVPKAIALKLQANWPSGTRGTIWLNGKELSGPIEGMLYRNIPALDAKLLRTGANTLQVRASIRARRETPIPPFRMRIVAMTGDDLSFDVPPILGAAGDDFFTVGMRLSMPAEASILVKGSGKSIEKDSPKPGLLHQFRIENLPPGEYAYTVAASFAADGGRREVRSKTLKVQVGPVAKNWQFIALGDSRSRPEYWKKVLTAAGKHPVRMILHSGDIVGNGREYESWSNEFGVPAADVLGRIPFYPVLGNHEENSPIFDSLFVLPGTREYWSQRRGDVLFIGIDGQRNWQEGSDLYEKLEQELRATKAKHIFLITHYPAASSSSHAKLDEQGRYKERAMRYSHDVLAPLCAKYGVAGIIAGHDHCYERSELEGITAITSGGAGATNYPQADDGEVRNPDSKVFWSGLHYLLFDVGPDEIRMRAIDLKGKVRDTKTWKARAASPAPVK